MTSGGSPPGFGGVAGGFGDVGQAAVTYQEMVRGMKRLKDIENNVATDSIFMEKYVKELFKVCWYVSGRPEPSSNKSTRGSSTCSPRPRVDEI